MFREILAFETRYHLRQPVFWACGLLFFLLTFGAVTTDAVIIGGALGNVNRNSPFVIMQFLLIMSVIGVFVTTAFVGAAAVRDHEQGTDAILFATPLRKRDYFFGRFAGALVIAMAVFLFVVLGIMIGSLMPWLEPERVGPFDLAPYVFSMGVLILPNVLITGAFFFSLAALTRSMLFTYVGVVGVFVAYAIGGALTADLQSERFGAMIDMFGLGAFFLETKYWTTIERNTELLPVAGTFLENRLLWLGVASAILSIAYVRFSLTAGVARTGHRRFRRRARVLAGGATAEPEDLAPIRLPPRSASAPAPPVLRRTQWWFQIRQDLKSVLKGLPFLIIVALGMLNVVGASTSMDQMFGTPVYPVTHLLISIIEAAFLLFVLIVVTFYAGELVFRERAHKLDEIYDALPVPNWIFWASKSAALVAAVFAVLAAGFIAAIGIQLFRGYTNFELTLYFKGLVLEIGVPLALIAVLALAAQVLTNNKYFGFLVMVAYFISLPILSALDFDHNLYKFAMAPSAVYSDMNGYGHFVAPLFWFTVYWFFFAALLLVAVHLGWIRGKEDRLRQRFDLARQRWNRRVTATVAIAGLAFVATGGFIFYNTNLLNDYVPADLAAERQARWEREYKRFEGIPQPRITDVLALVDIFPDRRHVDIRGRYTLVNRTGAPLDSLHLTVNPQVTIRELQVPGSRAEHEDAELGYYIFRFDEPLATGAALEMTFDLGVRTRGFVNNSPINQVVRNGTFFNNFEFLPGIGYSTVGELSDPNRRRRHGLPPIQRMPPIDDSANYGRHYITGASDWITFESVVSTSADQIALAPGYLERDWTDDGRRYFHYRMDSPILGFFAYMSADWLVAEDRWNDVDIKVYYDPAHPYNVDRMIEGVKKSLDYFTEEFGPYQHRQVRIIEFPRYAQFAQAFPNTIPFSESIGFIARLENEDAIDYVFYVTAHEVAHQWWAHQVVGANVQGASVLSETLSQYSALMVMERQYGPEMMRRFLKYELDAYLRGRGGELIEELPLVLVENQGYIHYRKGSLAMYALRDYIGEDAVNRALARFLVDHRFEGPPYPTARDLVAYLREEVPTEFPSLIEDLFETITLYDLRATEATCVAREDGTYAVRLTVDARKFRADGEGVETEIPVEDWIDVAVFGARGEGDPPEGRLLALEKRRIAQRETVFDIAVDDLPRRAGIDPFNKLVDRNPEDNLVTVGACPRPD